MAAQYIYTMQDLRKVVPPNREILRGMGLMIGVGVKVDPHEVVSAAQAHHLLVLTAGEDTVRLLPPLILTDKDIEEGAAALKLALDDVDKLRK